ncbi:MAG TPA: NUDIX domain-containing protein [Thermoanaerobaculia bacterium]|nr:NUDIX domain-containing protein [Thermoanaerobaculia bacterium]
MSAIDKLAWIHIDDGRLLCARSRGKDVYFIPGGKREAGESDEQALAREVREELTVTLDPASLRLLRVFEAQAHGRPEGVMVRMTCFTGEYEGTLQPAAEIEELAWLTHADRAQLSLVGQIILDWLHEQRMVR